MGLSYVTLGTNDLAAARLFYAAVMQVLEASIGAEVPGQAFCCHLANDGKMWITRPYDGDAASAGNGVTVALSARSPASVDAAHAAGLAAGGSNEGEPGPRPQYGPDVYVGYLRDPDGNKLALVHYRTHSDPAP